MKSTLRTATLLSLALLAGLTLLTPPSARAQINYQGTLTDSVGAILPDGQYNLNFSLWSVATGGSQLWGEYIADGLVATGHGPKADVVNGQFNVIIDNTAVGGGSLTTALSAATTPYLQIQVQRPGQGSYDLAITPRQQILAAPRALTADVIPNVTPNGINVGIGTSTAATKLTVSSLSYGIEHTDGTIRLSTYLGGGAGGGWIGTRSNHNLNLYVNDAQPSLTVATGGNVGIGQTIPAVKLDVAGQTLISTGGSSNELTLNASGANYAHFYRYSSTDSTISLGGSGTVTGVPSTPTMTWDVGTRSVGIGTDDPKVPLDVVGSTVITMDDNGYDEHIYTGPVSSVYTLSGSTAAAGLGIATFGMRYGFNNFPGDALVTGAVGIRSDNYIATAKGLLVYSDRRIKRDAQASATATDLKAIQELRVTDYRMVDPADGGNAWRKGFIAQEVEKVIPGAVSQSVEFVPDIFALATAALYDPAAKTLALTLPKDHGLKAGDRVRLHSDGKRVDLPVSAVPSARAFVVGPCESAPAKVLVYGRQVPDFRTVDYDRIFTTSVGAVQELARKLETQEAEFTRLRETHATLAQKLAALEARDQAREARLTRLEATRAPSPTTASLGGK